MNIASVRAANPYLTNKISADAQISGVVTAAPAPTQARPASNGSVVMAAITAAGFTGEIDPAMAIPLDRTRSKPPTPAEIAEIQRQDQVIKDVMERPASGGLSAEALAQGGVTPSADFYSNLWNYLKTTPLVTRNLDFKA